MKQGLWVLRFSVLALAASLGAASAPAPSSEIWITIGQEEAGVVLEALAEAGYAPALEVEAEGDIVVARIREDRLPLLSRVIHERLHRCGGFVAHESREAAFEAVAREQSLAPLEPLVEYTIDNGPVVQALLSGIQEANVRATIGTLAAFFTRYHTTQTGKDSATWIRDLWAGYAQGRSDVTVQLLSHPSSTTPQPSVILTIQGTTLAGEVVVLGAHQDSVNGGALWRAPGADDDASGVASLSEVIRVAMASHYRPQRTVKFMAYAAEEVGLRGSAAIAAQHRAANVDVVGVLQLDMTNYKGTPSADIAVITDHTSAAQNAFIEQLVDLYLGLPRTTTQCGYGCSDHASWNSRGYAASFPFEAEFDDSNPSIHSADDTLAKSDNNASHAVKFAKLAAAYLAELAKGGLDDDGNLPPTASAGADQSVVAGTAVTLNGSGSDPDGGPGPLTFAWSQVSGPAAAIADSDKAVASVTPATAGVYVFRLTVSDGSASAGDDVAVTASTPPGTAEYDATLRAPRCGLVGSSCDSGPLLLLGRGTRGPEPNQPNTVAGSCADGGAGTFHSDESNDRIVVATIDGTPLAPGTTVRIEASVWAWTNPSADHLDLYYTASASSPAWTFLTTLTPSAAGAQALSATYTLPAGALQAVRARFRYQGSAAACGTGSYDDHDDLVFAVGAPVPDFGVSASPAGLTIAQGGSGASTVIVSSSNGFASAVGLSCTGLPAGATCGFRPASVTPPANGSATSTLTVSVGPGTAVGGYSAPIVAASGALTRTTPLTLTVTPAGGGPQAAEYDATLRAPRCGLVGSSCDSGPSLLLGRGTRGPEPNQPNTVAGSCADGSSGTFHSDESNDRLVVSTLDGTPLAPGKTVRIEATVWAWTTPSADHLDLYYTASASSPAWTFLTTLTPSAGGRQTLSATYTLPVGALQAVRARFRYQGSAAACAVGWYDDHDDLVFAVQ